jgi:integrase
MPLSFLLLRTVNATVNVFTMKLNYSDPKIYTGGVDISTWSRLAIDERKKALTKDWFVYFSFRNPATGKLEKQSFIKAGANRLKTKRERYGFLQTMQQALLELLQYGFNPYQDNSALEESMFSLEKSAVKIELVPKKESQPIVELENDITITIEEAFKKGLELKEQMMNTDSFVRYRSRINRFIKWMQAHKIYKKPITTITKKLVMDYLNEELIRTSARSRNNTRTDISSLFQVLEDNEIVKDNFVKKISVLKSTPTRNKTYTPKQEKLIYEYLEKQDPHLLLFIKFITFGFLRPIEVCRLKVEDIDVEDQKLYVKAKNQPVKIKRIPEILIDLLPKVSKMNPKHSLFSKDVIGAEWEIGTTDKRSFFTKKFKKVKEHLGLGMEYGLYSFRHTSITNLYREFRESVSQHEAKSKLLPITGHATMKALEKYLRDIDAELPDDFSEFLK